MVYRRRRTTISISRIGWWWNEASFVGRHTIQRVTTLFRARGLYLWIAFDARSSVRWVGIGRVVMAWGGDEFIFYSDTHTGWGNAKQVPFNAISCWVEYSRWFAGINVSFPLLTPLPGCKLMHCTHVSQRGRVMRWVYINIEIARDYDVDDK